MKKFVVTFLLSIVMLLGATTSAFAQSPTRYRVSEVSRLERHEVIEGDFFATGERVEILGTINGDLYSAGGMIIIDGVINGDVLVAGGNIDISGEVDQDVRAAGGNVTISGQVGGSATVLSGNFDITDSAAIGAGLVALGGNIDLRGPVEKSVKVGAGNLTVSTSVNDDLDAAVGSLRLTPEASVSGDITYWSEDPADIDAQASVSGTIKRHDPPKFAAGNEAEAAADGLAKGLGLMASITSLLTTLVIGLLAIKFAPILMKNSSEDVKKELWTSLAVGFLAMILVPAVLLVLFITLFGIPLALLLGTVFMILVYLSRIPVMIAVGDKMLKLANQKQNTYLAFLIGIALYYLLVMIPIIGGLTKLAVLFAGVGASFIHKKSVYLQARKKELI